jgi:hypothetical protein
MHNPGVFTIDVCSPVTVEWRSARLKVPPEQCLLQAHANLNPHSNPLKLGPSSGPAVSSLEVYTTPALHGYWTWFGAQARAGILQTLTIAATRSKQAKSR